MRYTASSVLNCLYLVLFYFFAGPLASMVLAETELAPDSYVVKGGESLSTIARKHGVTSRAIMTYNKLDAAPLKVGQVIRIPGSSPSPAAPAQAVPLYVPAPIADGANPGGGDVGMALIIGIGNYEILGPLDNCREDAKAVYQVLLSAGYLPGRVVLLTDDSPTTENKATYTNIKRRLKQVCDFVKPEDSLVVYFAGHGTSIDDEVYLVPQDGDEKDRDNGISLTKLQQQMQSSKAGQKLLVLDACHSGGATRGVSGITPSLKTVGVHVMASCAASELSHPDPETKHGIFTRYLLEGLHGRADSNTDGSVTQKELFGYVQKQMIDWGLRSGKTQRPQMLSPTPDDITITKVAGGVRNPREERAPITAETSKGTLLPSKDPRSP